MQLVRVASDVPATPGRENMVSMSGWFLSHGIRQALAGRRPVHRVSLDELWMDKYAVTNEQFARFVDATEYITLARPPNPEDYRGAKDFVRV